MSDSERHEAGLRSDDATIVQSVLAGHSGRFRVLVERHQRAVFGLLAGFLRSEADRDDVAQEAYLAAWRGLASFDPARGTFRAWLLRIARNRALNSARDRRKRDEATAASGRPALSRRPDEPASFHRLDAVLADLGDEQRSAFVLVEMHGLSLAEAAEIEDVPLGTLKSRLSRALERLRESLRAPTSAPLVEPP